MQIVKYVENVKKDYCICFYIVKNVEFLWEKKNIVKSMLKDKYDEDMTEKTWGKCFYLILKPKKN